MKTNVVKGRYFDDLMVQPQALEKTFAWLGVENRWSHTADFLRGHTWKRIVLTGMGSSFHTFHPLYLALIASGYEVVMMETSELVHYAKTLCALDTLIITVSQSGRSAETICLLDMKGDATVLGVTNTADSPLAGRADMALLTQAGPEFSVSCKTYVSGMLVLQWLSAILSGASEAESLKALAPAPRMVGDYLETWSTHCSALAERLNGIKDIFFVGRGASLAAVGTGGLIVKESDHFHAEGMSSAAFRHGPMEMLQDTMFTVVFQGDEKTSHLNQHLIADLNGRGMKCSLVGGRADFAPFALAGDGTPLQPILEILPVEMITLALAALSGREAGRFEHASKVTDTE